MHARIGRISFSPDKADEVTSHVQANVVPKYEDTDGFKGFTLIADRSSGKAIGTSYWESEEAMKASEEAVKDSRKAAADAGGASGEPQVERYEVVIDTMA